MIHLILDNLRFPSGVGLDAGLQFQGLILYLDGSITFTKSRAAEKRQTTFFGVVYAALFDDLGIEHRCICKSSSALIEKCNDTLAYTYHIRRHTDTAALVCYQRIEQVLCNLQISFCDISNFPVINI